MVSGTKQRGIFDGGCIIALKGKQILFAFCQELVILVSFLHVIGAVGFNNLSDPIVETHLNYFSWKLYFFLGLLTPVFHHSDIHVVEERTGQ